MISKLSYSLDLRFSTNLITPALLVSKVGLVALSMNLNSFWKVDRTPHLATTVLHKTSKHPFFRWLHGARGHERLDQLREPHQQLSPVLRSCQSFESPCHLQHEGPRRHAEERPARQARLHLQARELEPGQVQVRGMLRTWVHDIRAAGSGAKDSDCRGDDCSRCLWIWMEAVSPLFSGRRQK